MHSYNIVIFIRDIVLLYISFRKFSSLVSLLLNLFSFHPQSFFLFSDNILMTELDYVSFLLTCFVHNIFSGVCYFCGLNTYVLQHASYIICDKIPV